MFKSFYLLQLTAVYEFNKKDPGKKINSKELERQIVHENIQ